MTEPAAQSTPEYDTPARAANDAAPTAPANDTYDDAARTLPPVQPDLTTLLERAASGAVEQAVRSACDEVEAAAQRVVESVATAHAAPLASAVAEQLSSITREQAAQAASLHGHITDATASAADRVVGAVATQVRDDVDRHAERVVGALSSQFEASLAASADHIEDELSALVRRRSDAVVDRIERAVTAAEQRIHAAVAGAESRLGALVAQREGGAVDGALVDAIVARVAEQVGASMSKQIPRVVAAGMSVRPPAPGADEVAATVLERLADPLTEKLFDRMAIYLSAMRDAIDVSVRRSLDAKFPSARRDDDGDDERTTLPAPVVSAPHVPPGTRPSLVPPPPGAADEAPARPRRHTPARLRSIRETMRPATAPGIAPVSPVDDLTAFAMSVPAPAITEAPARAPSIAPPPPAAASEPAPAVSPAPASSVFRAATLPAPGSPRGERVSRPSVTPFTPSPSARPATVTTARPAAVTTARPAAVVSASPAPMVSAPPAAFVSARPDAVVSAPPSPVTSSAPPAVLSLAPPHTPIMADASGAWSPSPDDVERAVVEHARGSRRDLYLVAAVFVCWLGASLASAPHGARARSARAPVASAHVVAERAAPLPDAPAAQPPAEPPPPAEPSRALPLAAGPELPDASETASAVEPGACTPPTPAEPVHSAAMYGPPAASAVPAGPPVEGLAMSAATHTMSASSTASAPVETAPVEPAHTPLEPTHTTVEIAPVETAPTATAVTPEAPVAEPPSPDAARLLEAARTSRGRYSARLAAWNAYFAAAPHDDRAMSEFALSLADLDHYREAVRVASLAIAANPRNDQAWYVIAWCRSMTGDTRGAREARARCLALNGEWTRECRGL